MTGDRELPNPLSQSSKRPYNGDMDQLDSKLDVLEKKIDELQRSINKIRKIFLWMLILTLLFFLLPLAGLFFLIPKFLSTYSNILQLQ